MIMKGLILRVMTASDNVKDSIRSAPDINVTDMRESRAGALRIECVELSRTLTLWGLNEGLSGK